MPNRLILASASPFRRALMKNAGLAFDVEVADINERRVEQGLGQGAAPSDVALVLARAKAAEVSVRRPDALVIGSDQTMSLGEQVFHKPQDREEASRQLQFLAGKTHRLNSAIAFYENGRCLWDHVAVAELTMRAFSDQFLEAYLDRAGAAVFKSVGGYQLEGEGIQLFSAIHGDYFTIIGLPMLPLLEKLRDLGCINV